MLTPGCPSRRPEVRWWRPGPHARSCSAAVWSGSTRRAAARLQPAPPYCCCAPPPVRAMDAMDAVIVECVASQLNVTRKTEAKLNIAARRNDLRLQKRGITTSRTPFARSDRIADLGVVPKGDSKALRAGAVTASDSAMKAITTTLS